MTLEGRSTPIFVVTTIFLSISFVSVATRCFVRLRLMKSFGWDDVLMVFAMALNIWFATCGIVGSLYGIGERLDEFVSLADLKTALFWWWLGQAAYIWVVTMTRISVAMSILRFTTQRLHRTVMYAVMALTSVIDATLWFVLMFQCHPMREFWQRTGQGHCIDTDYVINIAYLYSAAACLCDFILVIIAGHLVKGLPMSWWSKLALTGTLSMGCVASAAVVVRIPYLHNYKDRDFLYATANISVLSNIEAGLGITAGSLNTLRPLVRWLRDVSYSISRRFGSTAGGSALCNFGGTQNRRVRLNSSSPVHWPQNIELGQAGHTAYSNQTCGDKEEELSPQATAKYHEWL